MECSEGNYVDKSGLKSENIWFRMYSRLVHSHKTCSMFNGPSQLFGLLPVIMWL